MSAADISARVVDGMERLTEATLLSVIRRYLPYIFGEDAQILGPNDLDSLEIDPDFLVKLAENNFAIIDVRNQTPNTNGRMEALANRLLDYSRILRSSYPRAKISRVLITVGSLSVFTRDRLMELGVDRIITADDLRRMLDAGTIPHSAADPAINTERDSPKFGGETRGDLTLGSAPEIFVKLLESVKPGRPTWAQYQKLAGDILEFLFCPRLAKPIPELSNQARTNRRDFIFPNYAMDGYWASLRSHYSAHFVVVDAKNYKGGVGKAEVLQIANYLSDHGAGLFGLIVSRNGGKRDAEITQREQWAIYRKMIVILDDADMKQMLAIRSSGGDPADLIRQKIEDFRLSF